MFLRFLVFEDRVFLWSSLSWDWLCRQGWPGTQIHLPLLPCFFNDETICLIFTSGNLAATTPAEADLKDQATPKSENSSQPTKNARRAARAKQQLLRQQHSKKPFQKMNGISKGSGSSTEASVPNAQESARPLESSQSDGKAKVIGNRKRGGKLKQRGPTWKPSKEAAVPKQGAPPKGEDSGTPAVPTPSGATPRPKDCPQSLGKAKKIQKVKQQLSEQPAKGAASPKEDAVPKGPSAPTVSPHSSIRPPPAKRRKSMTKGSSQPLLS